jgi:hypothetical protein
MVTHLPNALFTPQTAAARVRVGRAAASARASITPAGLLAAGALTVGILLSIAPIIRAARGRSKK